MASESSSVSSASLKPLETGSYPYEDDDLISPMKASRVVKESSDDIQYGKQLKEILRKNAYFYDLYMDEAGWVEVERIFGILDKTDRIYLTYKQLQDYYDTFSAKTSEQDEIKMTLLSKIEQLIRGLDNLRGLLYTGNVKTVAKAHETIDRIIRLNGKQRFKKKVDVEKKKSYIRILQGQRSYLSRKAKLNYDKIFDRKIDMSSIGDITHFVHATNKDSYKSIVDVGALYRMTRAHVHLSKTAENATTYRKTAKILLRVDTGSSLNDGIEYWEAGNGVILSSGKNNTGFITANYIHAEKNPDCVDADADADKELEEIIKYGNANIRKNVDAFTTRVTEIESDEYDTNYTNKLPHMIAHDGRDYFNHPALATTLCNRILNDAKYQRRILEVSNIDPAAYVSEPESAVGTPSGSRSATPHGSPSPIPTYPYPSHSLGSYMPPSPRPLSRAGQSPVKQLGLKPLKTPSPTLPLDETMSPNSMMRYKLTQPQPEQQQSHGAMGSSHRTAVPPVNMGQSMAGIQLHPATELRQSVSVPESFARNLIKSALPDDDTSK
jgi:RNA:NAD 2'-phosphotransferase (TPT1/KptA family)